MFEDLSILTLFLPMPPQCLFVIFDTSVVHFTFNFITVGMLLWYGDGAGNTVEENSRVFSLIRMH